MPCISIWPQTQGSKWTSGPLASASRLLWLQAYGTCMIHTFIQCWRWKPQVHSCRASNLLTEPHPQWLTNTENVVFERILNSGILEKQVYWGGKKEMLVLIQQGAWTFFSQQELLSPWGWAPPLQRCSHHPPVRPAHSDQLGPLFLSISFLSWREHVCKWKTRGKQKQRSNESSWGSCTS